MTAAPKTRSRWHSARMFLAAAVSALVLDSVLLGASIRASGSEIGVAVILLANAVTGWLCVRERKNSVAAGLVVGLAGAVVVTAAYVVYLFSHWSVG